MPGADLRDPCTSVADARHAAGTGTLTSMPTATLTPAALLDRAVVDCCCTGGGVHHEDLQLMNAAGSSEPDQNDCHPLMIVKPGSRMDKPSVEAGANTTGNFKAVDRGTVFRSLLPAAWRVLVDDARCCSDIREALENELCCAIHSLQSPFRFTSECLTRAEAFQRGPLADANVNMPGQPARQPGA